MLVDGISTSDLNRKAIRRVRRCGAPLYGRTSPGAEPIPIRWRCEHRACDYCSRQYRQSLHNAICSTLSGEDEACLVTLTDHSPSCALTSAELERRSKDRSARLEAATQTLRDVERRQRLRDKWYGLAEDAETDSERRRCLRWAWEMEKSLLELGAELRPETELEQYVSEWKPSDQPPDVDATYLWSKEVTTGDDGDRWHVHFHVAVPDEATAQVLNAAWQDERAGDYFNQTDISPPAAADSQEIAAELAKYVAKSRSPATDDPAPDGASLEILRGLEDQRLYSAAGRWRPLGRNRGRIDAGDPIEEVTTPMLKDLGLWETWDEFWEADSFVREGLDRTAAWADELDGHERRAAWRDAVLETDTNYSETPVPHSFRRRYEKHCEEREQWTDEHREDSG